jgi:V8-like Glu-specific endopeptidase
LLTEPTGAVGIIDKRLGDSLGFLATKLIVSSQQNQAQFFHLGYPGDKQPSTRRSYRQEAISATRINECDSNGPFATDADAMGGQSGGPIWILENGTRFQYGMCSSGGSTSTSFTGMQPWINAVAKARTDYP